MKKIIFHIDVNNAFLSWTAVDLLEHGYKIDIRNEYAVIGGNEETRSGIVLAKSTPAKKLGVTSAETLYQARKKVPKLLVFHFPYPPVQLIHKLPLPNSEASYFHLPNTYPHQGQQESCPNLQAL